MASNTTNLNLLKKDPVADANDTFNIETMLNENWDKIDQADVENVKKVTGKGLSTENYTTLEKSKLAAIEVNANNYTHPATHNASIINTDSTHRFVTDAEKSDWNELENKIEDGIKYSVDKIENEIIGTSNKSVFLKKSATLEADTRNLEIKRDSLGRIANVNEKNDVDIIVSTSITRDTKGNILSATESDDTITVIYTVNRDENNKITSIEKEVI